MRRLLPDPPGELDDAALVEAYRLAPGRHVRINFIASLDAAVTVAGRSGGLGTPGDLTVFRLLRALADVVLVGHGTSSTEGYGPITPESAVGRLRSSLGRSPVAPIAVVSRRASLAVGDKLLGGRTFLITCADSDPDRRAALTEAGVEVLVCGDDEVDLALALDLLAERGLEQVVCEGGPMLFGSALRARVVDELDLSIAPALVGAEARLLGEAGLDEVVRPRLLQVLEEDGVLFTRYAIDGAA